MLSAVLLFVPSTRHQPEAIADNMCVCFKLTRIKWMKGQVKNVQSKFVKYTTPCATLITLLLCVGVCVLFVFMLPLWAEQIASKTVSDCLAKGIDYRVGRLSNGILK